MRGIREVRRLAVLLKNVEKCDQGQLIKKIFESHVYVFFGEMSVQVFSPRFDCVVYFSGLSCMSCLYILEINPLSVVSFAIIFSHSEGCLFTLHKVSIAVRKLLSLIRSHLFTFVFISITLGDESQRIFDLCQVFCLCFSLRVLQFLVLHLGL